MSQKASRMPVVHGQSTRVAGAPRRSVRSVTRRFGRTLTFGLFLGLLGGAGCARGSSDSATADSAATSPPRALEDKYGSSLGDSVTGARDGSVAVASADDTACPMTGLWRRCNVEERLERSGFVVRPGSDSVRQPGLLIAGTAVLLGRAELQLYFYADSADARRQADALYVGMARPADATGVLREPAVIRSNNLLALLFNNNDRQLERVELGLTAGLPAR